MPLIKPKENWKDEEGAGVYDGPPPPAGTYKGEVHRMGLTTSKSGENQGADMWVVGVRITEGKYKGWTGLRNFVMVKQSAWAFNQFLKAMTDGSEKQKQTILDWYYERGYSLEAEEKYKNLGRQCEFIGKPAFKPIGKSIVFAITKNGEYTNVDRFLVPLEDSDEGADEPETLAEAEAVETEPETSEDEGAFGEATETEAEADDDDPWG